MIPIVPIALNGAGRPLSLASPSLEVEMPRTARTGESFRMRAWIVNRTRQTFTIAAPSPLGGPLGVRYDGDLWRGGKRVPSEIAGRWYGQWESANVIDETHFVTLKPGMRLPLEDTSYGREYRSGTRPSLIRQIAKAPKRALPPGRYELRISFRVSPEDPTKSRQPGSGLRPRMTPGARKLFARMWSGQLRHVRTFEVLPAR